MTRTNVISMTTHRSRQDVRAMDAIDKIFNRVNSSISRSWLREVTALVRSHFPAVDLRKAWTYCYGRGQWEFHAPDGYYWYGSASGAYDARCNGWTAWLAHKGVDLDNGTQKVQP